MEEKRINEIFLGLIFILLLVLLVFSVTGVSAISGQSKTTTTITDSYNTYNYYSSGYGGYDYGYENQKLLISHPTKKHYQHYSGYNNYYDDNVRVKYHKNYYGYDDGYYADDSDDYYFFREDDTRTRYDSRGASHSRYYGLFDSEVNKYKVNVKNQEHEGKYFTVKYYLTDYNGDTRTEVVTEYLSPHESKNFVYKNVFDEDKEYKYWRYKIVPYD